MSFDREGRCSNHRQIDCVTCLAFERVELQAALAAAREEVARLREALGSIAANTCCEPCQEAKLVARAALASTPRGGAAVFTSEKVPLERLEAIADAMDNAKVVRYAAAPVEGAKTYQAVCRNRWCRKYFYEGPDEPPALCPECSESLDVMSRVEGAKGADTSLSTQELDAWVKSRGISVADAEQLRAVFFQRDTAMERLAVARLERADAVGVRDSARNEARALRARCEDLEAALATSAPKPAKL